MAFMKLSDICLQICDGVHNTVIDTPNEPYYLLSAKNIKNGRVNIFDDDRTISLETMKILNKRTKLAKDDVVLTTVGSIGEVALIRDNDINYEFQRSVGIFKPNKEIIYPKYLYYCLKSKSVNTYLKNNTTGAAQPCLFIGFLKKLKIDICDYKKQIEIADKLSKFDEAIENNERQIKTLEEMAQILYKEWFVHFRFPGQEKSETANTMPLDWEIKKAQDLFDIKIGRTPSRAIFDYFSEEKNDNMRWVSIADMRDKIYVDETSEYLTLEAIKKVNMPLIQPDTIILSFKLTVGKVAITTEISSTNEAIAHFNTNNPLLKEYTYLYLRNFNYSELGNTSAIGTAINSTIVKKMPFVLPTKQILEDFSKLIKPIFDEIKKLTKKIKVLTEQRDLLLPRLMGGKLSV